MMVGKERGIKKKRKGVRSNFGCDRWIWRDVEWRKVVMHWVKINNKASWFEALEAFPSEVDGRLEKVKKKIRFEVHHMSFIVYVWGSAGFLSWVDWIYCTYNESSTWLLYEYAKCNNNFVEGFWLARRNEVIQIVGAALVRVRIDRYKYEKIRKNVCSSSLQPKSWDKLCDWFDRWSYLFTIDLKEWDEILPLDLLLEMTNCPTTSLVFWFLFFSSFSRNSKW